MVAERDSRIDFELHASNSHQPAMKPLPNHHEG
jgi:hypothetical protein